MKYYLAAKYSRREEMEQIANDIDKSDQHKCTARWVYGGEEGLSRADIALLDFEDIDKADVLICFTHPRGIPQPGGGRFVEMGYAMGKGKKVFCVGEFENVFMEHPDVIRIPTIDHIWEYL